jgi:predicted AlkP superfamily phosphohydrolase/phosphomutase
VEAAAQEATGGFVGNGASAAYEEGQLGPPLWAGGDGAAESRYLETVALTVRQFTRLFDYAHDHTRWDLLLTYLPYPDEAAHVWLGRLDPTLPGHDPALAERLRPCLDGILRVVDEHIGHIHERVGAEVIVAVAADHGHAGADLTLRPNVALAEAGLLALGRAGEIDLARTRAVYFPGNSSFVRVNRTSYRRGIVDSADEESVRREVTRVLKALRDPITRLPVVLDVLDARVPHEPALGGPRGGDLYLVVVPRVSLSPSVKGAAVEQGAPRGDHIGDPRRIEMQAAFAIAGPGVAAGADLGRIHQVDVAPTLAALLGIGPPRHAVGWVLERALAHPPRPAAGR